MDGNSPGVMNLIITAYQTAPNGLMTWAAMDGATMNLNITQMLL
jgi:hypothetical protein